MTQAAQVPLNFADDVPLFALTRRAERVAMLKKTKVFQSINLGNYESWPQQSRQGTTRAKQCSKFDGWRRTVPR